MKEIPILFSTPMVQAILDGRKTMTRRMTGLDQVNEDPDAIEFVRFQEYKDGSYRAIFQHELADEPGSVKCPYGKSGDLLWVRETWRKSDFPEADGIYEFKANMPNPDAAWNKGIWKPCIHMPKAAARIWLQVEEIRVERLREISQEDAIAEGMKFNRLFDEWGGVVKHPTVEDHFRWYSNPADAFNNLWITINGMESFKSNPWVWVVKFKVLSTTGKPQL